MNHYTDFLQKLNLKTSERIKHFRNIYNLKLELAGMPVASFGKGETLEEARLSAYGEMCERLLMGNFFEEYYINGLYPDMKYLKKPEKKLSEIYNLDLLTDEDLIDFNSDSFDIASIPFIEKSTGRTVYFPVNIIQNLYVSNGMAVHFDFEKAYYNAKCEIIERYVKFDVVKYALPLPKISHRLNTSDIQIYDATLNGKYPVMAASYIQNEEIILSFGCDLDKETAIKKAYLELLQTEFKEKGKITGSIEDVRSEYNLNRHFINLSGDIHSNFFKPSYFKKSEWNFNTLDLFDKEEYYRVIKKGKLTAVHLIIPGISEIYPFENMILNDLNYPKLYYRNKLLNFTKYDKKEILELLSEFNIPIPREIGRTIGVIYKRPFFIDEFVKAVEEQKQPQFSDNYINILNLARKLNEI